MTLQQKTLKQLIEFLKLDYVNSDITEQNFPDIGRSSDIDAVQFDKELTTKEIIAEIKKTGHEPANARELLEWAKKNWNGKDWIVALGQRWNAASGVPYALTLGSRAGYRGVGLSVCGPRSQWGRSVLCARRKSLRNSEPKTLESFNPLAFEIKYKGEEYKIVKI